jgi:hypothetical protein
MIAVGVVLRTLYLVPAWVPSGFFFSKGRPDKYIFKPLKSILLVTLVKYSECANKFVYIFNINVACGVCGGQSGTGAGFLRVLRFPLPNIPPISSLS